MAEGILNKLILWALLGIFLVIILFAFFSKTGLMQSISKLALGAEKFLPSETSKDVKQDESVPPNVLSVREKFMLDISRFPDKENCLLEYSSLEKLDAFRIKLVNDNGKITSSIIKPVGKEGGINLNVMTIDKNLGVCIVNAEAIYNYYLSNGDKQLSVIMYDDAESIELSKDGVIENGNLFGLGQGILFKPQRNKVCLIPTYSGFGTWFGCDASKDTLDDDCITKLKTKIKLCSTS